MDVQYIVAKCRLKNIVRHPENLRVIERKFFLAHEATKRAFFFLPLQWWGAKGRALHPSAVSQPGHFQGTQRSQAQRLRTILKV